MLFCFFFFKQKTAYEMRISDWSSDVCSSDLHHVMGVLDAVEVVLIGRVAVAILPTDAHHFARVVGIEDGPVCFPANLAAVFAEIGRASCRERVCQYV